MREIRINFWSAGKLFRKLQLQRVPVLCAFMLFGAAWSGAAEENVLEPSNFAHHIERFNAMSAETVVNLISDAESWDWLQRNIPFFECPDKAVEEIYYFRWWSFRKHLKQTPKGLVFTEFLTPVGHAR